MRSPSLQHPRLRFLPVFAAVLAFSACGDGESPLDPTSEPTTPAATEPAAVSPVPSGNLTITSQTIAWISYRTGWTELFKMDPLGIQSTQLTALKTTLQGVSWSWDDKRLATVRYRGIDAFHGHNDIWIINSDGSNGHWARAQTFPYDLYDPSFSPDGSRIVMTVNVGGTKALGWIDLATGNANLFWKSGGGALLGWKPSYNKAGTKILYSTGFTLDQINPDGSGHVVRVNPGAWVDHGLYSPDGKKIVYQKGASPGNIDIYVKNFSTGVTTRLTWSTAVDAFPSWSPDGTEIAFMSNRSGKDQVYTMDAATGGSQLRITHTSVEEWAPVWAH
jgi:Tol biopolymer transport system component